MRGGSAAAPAGRVRASASSAPASVPAPATRTRPRCGSSRRRCSRPSRRACSTPTSLPSGSRRACCLSSGFSSPATARRRTGWPTSCCSSAPRPGRPAPATPRRASRRYARSTAWPPCADRLPHERTRPLRPALIVQARKRVASAKKRGARSLAARSTASGASPNSSRSSATRCAGCTPTAGAWPTSCRPRSPDPARVRRAARAAGDGGRDQPALPRCVAFEDGDLDDPQQAERVRRLAERVAAVRRSGQAPDPLSSHGWRSFTGASPTGRRWAASFTVACLPVRVREADRPVLPQPCRHPGACPGAWPALGDARRALGAGAGPGLAGRAAHA